MVTSAPSFFKLVTNSQKRQEDYKWKQFDEIPKKGLHNTSSCVIFVLAPQDIRWKTTVF